MTGEVTFSLAGLRVTPTPWDTAGNFALLEHHATQAAKAGADVVVTPEGFLEGYVWNHIVPGEFSKERYFDIGASADGSLMTQVAALAARLGVYLVVGFAERRAEEMFNSVSFFAPSGDEVLRYSKTHTAGDEPFNSKGNEFPVVDTAWGRWGALICMDRQLPETARILAIKGARVLVVPAWGQCGELNDAMMRTRAAENGLYVAFVHPQRCLIVDPAGAVIASDRGTGDEVVMANITITPERPPSALGRRRPDIYGELLMPSIETTTG